MGDNRERVGALNVAAAAHERYCRTCQEQFVTLIHRADEPHAWWVEPPQYCPRCGRRVTA